MNNLKRSGKGLVHNTCCINVCQVNTMCANTYLTLKSDTDADVQCNTHTYIYEGGTQEGFCSN